MNVASAKPAKPDYEPVIYATGKVRHLKCEHCKDVFQHECEDAS